MDDIRVGIIGLRHLHPRSYMPLFQAVPGMSVVAAAEREPAILTSFRRDFRTSGYADWRDLIESERLDLAVVFLPHAECPAAAVACARKGINLLVEKPMAADVRGALEMIAAAHRANIILSAPYVWRFHPVCREIKRLLELGTLGKIVACEGRCAAGRPERYVESGVTWMLQKTLSGGGPMHNLGVHWIDLFRWLLTDEVTEAMARNVKVNVEYDIEDDSLALLSFSGGAVLALDISYGVPAGFPNGRDLYISLRGTRGSLSWCPAFGSLQEEFLVCSDAGEFAAAGGRRIRLDLPEVEGYAGVAGLEFLRELTRALRGHSLPPVTGEDGLRALEVVEAVYRSAATARAVPVARAACP